MSLSETTTVTARIVVSTERGELPSNVELETLLGGALFHDYVDNDGNVSVLALQVIGRDNDGS